jgi:hypothetical protein
MVPPELAWNAPAARDVVGRGGDVTDAHELLRCLEVEHQRDDVSHVHAARESVLGCSPHLVIAARDQPASDRSALAAPSGAGSAAVQRVAGGGSDVQHGPALAARRDQPGVAQRREVV